MNIWFGSKENQELSNLAYRPFTDKVGRRYVTVEHAYQTWKSGSFNELVYMMAWHAGAKNMSSWECKKDGNWNIDLMERIMRASFEQNPEAIALLLATGRKRFTHNQDRGIWRTEFPRILTKLRTEFRKKA